MGRSPSPEAKRQRREERGRDYDRESNRDRRGRDRSRDRDDADRGRDRDRKHRARDDGAGERNRDRDESRGRERGKDFNDTDNKPTPKLKADEQKSPPKFKPEARKPQEWDELGATVVKSEKKDESILAMEAAEAALEAKETAKEKASFEYTGKLAAETNKVNGVALLFTEPPEARRPSVRWRLYVFKDGEPLEEPLLIHRQSCYLFGRERKIADIPIDHPSCSKQHAVLQYRLIQNEVDGSKKIRPYLMDLGSTNKTFLNGEPLDSQRYYELFEKDAIKFGNSSREYILLHENSA